MEATLLHFILTYADEMLTFGTMIAALGVGFVLGRYNFPYQRKGLPEPPYIPPMNPDLSLADHKVFIDIKYSVLMGIENELKSLSPLELASGKGRALRWKARKLKIQIELAESRFDRAVKANIPNVQPDTTRP